METEVPEKESEAEKPKKGWRKALLGLVCAVLTYFGSDYAIRNYTGGPAYDKVTSASVKCDHDHKIENLDELLSFLSMTRNKDCMLNASIEAINKAADKGYSAIMLNEVSKLQKVNNIGKETARFPALVHKTSPAWKKLRQQLGEDAEFVEQNLEWLVLTPNIPIVKGKEDAGLSSGKKVIYVDTVAEDGTVRDPIEYGPVIAHEAQHEANQNLGILKNEKSALVRQMKVASNLLKENKTLQGMVNECTKRIQTADYLEKFEDFNDVYPMSSILAEGLLNAGIKPEVLRKYHKVSTGNAELDAELSAASRCASIVRDCNLYRATIKLHNLAENGTPVEQVNAVSALCWLYPALNKSKNTAGWYSGEGRSAGFDFEGGSGGPGAVSSGYSVRNLPSLKKFLEDARAEDRSLVGRLFGKPKQGTYEEKHEDVNLKQVAAKGKLEAALEELNKQCRYVRGPLPGFTYRGYVVQGAGTLVIWQNNSYKQNGEYPITKQDKYFNGEFQHSVINFIDKYEEQDLDANPPFYFSLKQK